METKANYVAVAAFVMNCVIGLVVALLWLAGAQYTQEYAYYQAYFKGPVTGLGKGTITRYNGIDVGRIKDLQFDPNDPQSVIVTLEVQPDLGIREDSIASIDSQGLTGGVYVEISGGTRNSPLLVAKDGQQYPILRTKQSTFAQLEQSAPELVAKLNDAATKLNDLLKDDNRRAVSSILNNLNTTTATLAARSGRYRCDNPQRQRGDGQSEQGIAELPAHNRQGEPDDRRYGYHGEEIRQSCRRCRCLHQWRWPGSTLRPDRRNAPHCQQYRPTVRPAQSRADQIAVRRPT